MPRQARLDFTGAIHHIVARGVAQSSIFSDDEDRKTCLGYLGDGLREGRLRCYAWCLMSNHIHLLIRTGPKPLFSVMHRILTRYALHYNRRHERAGHLFQNRYHSTLVDEGAYFLAALRYIHLNPIRAGMVETLFELAEYPWSGHRVLMGGSGPGWQDRAFVLDQYGSEESSARRSYERFLADGMRRDDEDMLTPRHPVANADSGVRSDSMSLESDGRVQGSGEFVARAVRLVEGRDRRRMRLGRRMSPDEVVEAACALNGVSVSLLGARTKAHDVALARGLASKWLVEDLGLPGVKAASLIGISKSAVTKAIPRGRARELEMGWSLDRVSQDVNLSTTSPK